MTTAGSVLPGTAPKLVTAHLSAPASVAFFATLRLDRPIGASLTISVSGSIHCQSLLSFSLTLARRIPFPLVFVPLVQDRSAASFKYHVNPLKLPSDFTLLLDLAQPFLLYDAASDTDLELKVERLRNELAGLWQAEEAFRKKVLAGQKEILARSISR